MQRMLIGAVAGAAVALSGAAIARSGDLARATSPVVKRDLEDAMKGEAFAYARYSLYAQQARRNGQTAAAELWERNAQTELNEHLKEHAEIAGLVGSDADNRRASIAGENYEHRTMYPQMAARAQRAGDRSTAHHFREVAADEGRHRDEYQAQLTALGRGGR